VHFALDHGRGGSVRGKSLTAIQYSNSLQYESLLQDHIPKFADPVTLSIETPSQQTIHSKAVPLKYPSPSPIKLIPPPPISPPPILPLILLPSPLLPILIPIIRLPRHIHPTLRHVHAILTCSHRAAHGLHPAAARVAVSMSVPAGIVVGVVARRVVTVMVSITTRFLARIAASLRTGLRCRSRTLVGRLGSSAGGSGACTRGWLREAALAARESMMRAEVGRARLLQGKEIQRV
jgi:hypothetical protein